MNLVNNPLPLTLFDAVRRCSGVYEGPGVYATIVHNFQFVDSSDWFDVLGYFCGRGLVKIGRKRLAVLLLLLSVILRTQAGYDMVLL